MKEPWPFFSFLKFFIPYKRLSDNIKELLFLFSSV